MASEFGASGRDGGLRGAGEGGGTGGQGEVSHLPTLHALSQVVCVVLACYILIPSAFYRLI